MQTSQLNLEPHSPDPGDAVSIFLDSGTPLPDFYGDQILVAMARDPFWLFTYWEVPAARWAALRAEWGSRMDQAVMVLRVSDVTGRADGPFWDVDVPPFTNQWYVQVPQSDREYRLDLGLRLADGTFILLVRSGVVRMPRGRVSDDVDAQWMAVRSSEEYEAWEKVLNNVDIGRGSAEFSRQMAQRWNFLKSVFSMPVPPSSWMQMPSSMPSSLPGSGSRPQ